MKEYVCGDIAIAFVTKFESIWNDRKSGARRNGAVWKPKTPAGYKPLGHLFTQPKDAWQLTGQEVVVVAKSIKPGALARPTDYKSIWKDRKSGAAQSVHIWEPVPPDNYVAMGAVAVGQHDVKPSLDEVWCVRSDLVARGQIATDLSIWDDSKSGASSDFSAWRVAIPTNLSRDKYMRLSPNSFVGVSSHKPPQANHNLNYILKLAVPVEEPKIPNKTPDAIKNELLELGVPNENNITEWQVVRSSKVPFLGINDPDYDASWKATNSPFYILERSEAYRCVEVLPNYSPDTEREAKRTNTVGMTKEQRQALSHKAGVSVAIEAGYTPPAETGGGSFKVTTTFSYEFGLTQEEAMTETTTTTAEDTYKIGVGQTCALWAKAIKLEIKRANGSSVMTQEFATGTITPVYYDNAKAVMA